METLKKTMEKLKKTMEKLKRHEPQKKFQNCKKNTKNNSAPIFKVRGKGVLFVIVASMAQND
jgi:predicted O-methyltransferase YrrM